MSRRIHIIDRRRLARELLLGAPVAGLVWLLVIRLFSGAWSFTFPLVIVGFSVFLAIFMVGPEPAGSLAFRFWRLLVFLIDWVITRIVSLILYFLLITPVGLVLRLFRVNLVDMRVDPGKTSCWRKVSPSADSRKQYFRQF